MELANISEPAILLCVNQHYRPGMSEVPLYDVTRGVWAARGERRSRVKFAFAIFHQEIKAVYQIKEWHPACTTPYASGRKIDFGKHASDWEFTGSPAPREFAAKYLNCRVPPFKGNPVRYLNT